MTPEPTRSTGGPTVTVSPFYCPQCTGQPRANDCHFCGRTGLTEDVIGWDPAEVVPAPRPPAVMKRPCADCAFRCGSPEQEADYELHGLRDRNRPFYCHTGLPLIEGHYRPVAEYQPHPEAPVLPLGAMVCAGWWDWRVGGMLPIKPYRELHSDQPGDQPDLGRGQDKTDDHPGGTPHG